MVHFDYCAHICVLSESAPLRVNLESAFNRLWTKGPWQLDPAEGWGLNERTVGLPPGPVSAAFFSAVVTTPETPPRAAPERCRQPFFRLLNHD